MRCLSKKPVKLQLGSFFRTTMVKHMRHTPIRRLSDLTIEDIGENVGLERALMDSRRVMNVLSPILRPLKTGIDWTDLANLRASDKKIVLFVRNSLQKTKLRQLLPRIEAAVQNAGITRPVEICVRPITKTPARTVVHSNSLPRTGSVAAADCIENKAASISDTALREVVLKLANTLRQKG